ncbi:iron-sulfur cluster assembly scaffold protein [Desulfatibacillum aliphaticivorans]|uniref:Nitrogen-fixing NifU domain protein n=1 Tax=Desulfatibacillum aliphaticivorans TaxID=218208 RepID=B8FAZ4_DESAL|nr:iron-sulfur cluster assembly scaffold protein [Desulfatibacillum aliphaticivorans]ACL04080.1 nitrogen-fixing NifU domain protein [Desulfatibacillum aliphaticivorans]
MGSDILQNYDAEAVKEMLQSSGYSDKAIQYYVERKGMGKLEEANQITELTGPCGDTMKVFLKIEDDKIQDAKIQVLGCPGAISSAMVAMDMAKGKTLEEAKTITEGVIFKELENIPDQKQHCIQLTVKTLQNAIEEYQKGNNHKEG